MLEDRLACLTGGIGVVRVGAYTDTEFNAKKYKFENAVNATQAALQEGIVAGGGMALLLTSNEVQESMFKTTLKAPFRQMATNAGINADVAFNNLMPRERGDGYDFRTKTFVNMFDAGIIDPFKVTRLALESATAIASSLICVETVIVNEVEKDNVTKRE
jgi:chaperonin GroEL